jgi:hypothetical protein
MDSPLHGNDKSIWKRDFGLAVIPRKKKVYGIIGAGAKILCCAWSQLSRVRELDPIREQKCSSLNAAIAGVL